MGLRSQLRLFERFLGPICVVLAIACWHGMVQAATSDDGVEALHRGDFATAYRIFKPLAEAGDRAAQNNLGILYRNGQGVPQNYAEALKWFRRSADQGSAWAQYNLGMAYQLGLGVPEDPQEAMRWYRLSADQDDAAAQTALGFMYRDGIGVARNKEEAIKWFKRAADQGETAARGALALLSRDLNSLAFIMPSYWILMRGTAVRDGQLLFRRFSFIVDRQNLANIDSGANEKVAILSDAGSLTNSMIFNCRRDRLKTDFLTIHLPDQLDPSSFAHQEWVSDLEIRFLADGRSGSFQGEYIKGDLFVDADQFSSLADFFKLLSASRIIIEFGDKKDRINLAISDQIGSANIGGFLREYLPRIPSLASGLKFLNVTDMTSMCSRYKSTGRF